MADTGSRHVAIWIDHRQAILLAFGVGSLAVSVAHRSGAGWSEYCVYAHKYPLAQGYYEAVLSYLRPEDEILIMGPGQAKRELRDQIECRGTLKGMVVGLYHASRLANVELVLPIDDARHTSAKARCVPRRPDAQQKGNLRRALDAGKDKCARPVL
jgi:hypothetical protein